MKNKNKTKMWIQVKQKVLWQIKKGEEKNNRKT